MKRLQDYISDSAAWVDNPAVGDDFGINIREECLVESHIVDVTEDGVVLAADDRMMEILESYGMLEASDPYRREMSPPSPEEFEEGLTTGALIGAALGAKGAWHAGKKAKMTGKDANIWKDTKNFVQGIVDPRTYIPKKKKSDVEQDVAEGSSNIGPSIKTLFQKIYDRGDDEIEYFYSESPVFALYWDKYEGDIDSIIAEVDPKELQIIHDELKSYVEGAGLAEGRVDSPVSSAITRRILNQRPDLLKYGPEAVMDAIDEVADWVGDVEEIGSSDVSAWVSQVARYLQTRDGQGIDESQAELARIQELAGMPPSAMPSVQEGAMKNWLDDLYYEFQERHDLPRDIDDDAYLGVVAKFLRDQGVDPDRIEDIGELFLDRRDHEEDDDHDYANQLDREQYDDESMMEDSTGKEIDYTSLVVDGIDTRDYPDFADAYFASGEYMDGTPIPDEVLDELTQDGDLLYDHIQKRLYEAEYHGRNVPLGKPMQGDVKKFKVYVKNPATGNIKKVNFGDKTMRIKKSNPKRRKSFRARHHCANPGPRTKARYWSCRKW
jgi:hypothetical protein